MSMSKKDWAILNGDQINIVRDGANVIAVVWADDNTNEIANARLIAAAPELLEALIEVKSWRMQSLDVMPPEIRGAWLRAEAAIAKATGAA